MQLLKNILKLLFGAVLLTLIGIASWNGLAIKGVRCKGLMQYTVEFGDKE